MNFVPERLILRAKQELGYGPGNGEAESSALMQKKALADEASGANKLSLPGLTSKSAVVISEQKVMVKAKPGDPISVSWTI